MVSSFIQTKTDFIRETCFSSQQAFLSFLFKPETTILHNGKANEQWDQVWKGCFLYKAVPVINALPAVQPPIAVCHHLVKMLPCLKPLVLLGMQLMSVNILMLLN